MPATPDDRVNDTEGDPLLVVTAEVNARLVQVFPSRFQELRRSRSLRRVTFVFDLGTAIHPLRSVDAGKTPGHCSAGLEHPG